MATSFTTVSVRLVESLSNFASSGSTTGGDNSAAGKSLLKSGSSGSSVENRNAGVVISRDPDGVVSSSNDSVEISAVAPTICASWLIAASGATLGWDSAGTAEGTSGGRIGRLESGSPEKLSVPKPEQPLRQNAQMLRQTMPILWNLLNSILACLEFLILVDSWHLFCLMLCMVVMISLLAQISAGIGGAVGRQPDRRRSPLRAQEKFA